MLTRFDCDKLSHAWLIQFLIWIIFLGLGWNCFGFSKTDLYTQLTITLIWELDIPSKNVSKLFQWYNVTLTLLSVRDNITLISLSPNITVSFVGLSGRIFFQWNSLDCRKTLPLQKREYSQFLYCKSCFYLAIFLILFGNFSILY